MVLPVLVTSSTSTSILSLYGIFSLVQKSAILYCAVSLKTGETDSSQDESTLMR